MNNIISIQLFEFIHDHRPRITSSDSLEALLPDTIEAELAKEHHWNGFGACCIETLPLEGIF